MWVFVVVVGKLKYELCTGNGASMLLYTAPMYVTKKTNSYFHIELTNKVNYNF